MNHLTSDELIDAMEGTLDAPRRSHLDTCGECRRAMADVSGVLREARQVEVPEPSPLYWRHFSAHVRAAIDADAPASAAWGRWLRWPVLAPLGALALLVLAFNLSVLEPTVAPETLSEGAGGDVAFVADGWGLVADMVGAIDWATARETGLIIEPGAADRAALELSPDEQRELTRLLRVELQRSQS